MLLKLPMPITLNHVNVYLIGDKNDYLLIDTGFPAQETLDTLLQYLKKYGYPKEVFITHYHPDHIGLVRLFSNSLSNSEIFINEKEIEFLNFLLDQSYEINMRKFYLAHGFPESLFENLLRSRNRIKEIVRDVKFNAIKDNEKIEVAGDYVKIIWTPGHTIGHSCIYYHEELFCGDHILPTITPNISLLQIEDNPLEHYYQSLDKVEQINPKIIYPAHGEPFDKVKERITEIKTHHENRLKEILEILLKKGKSTAYEIARNISWYKPWDELGNIDKQLAAGETLSHLKYLSEKGLVKEEQNAGKIYYSVRG